MARIVKLAQPEELDARPAVAGVMIVTVGIDTLKPAPWNPERRMRRATLKPLMDRIASEGFDVFRPILISKDGYIGDGHRRWLSAKELGLTRVPVVFTDRTVEDLWAGNAGQRPVSTREWLAVSIVGSVEPPERLKAIIEEMKPVLGDEGLRYLMDREVSPTIWRQVWRIGLYCKRKDNKFLRSSTYWLVKHRMQDKTNKALAGESPIDPRMLIQAIENDVPLRPTWDIGL